METNKWVIVANVGQEDEYILDTYPTWGKAMDAMDKLYNPSFVSGFDIMKRLPNGELTTEY